MLSVTYSAAAGAFALALIGSTAGISALLHKSHHATGLVPARDAMSSVLGAANPSASLGDEARTLDRFIGAWDSDFAFLHDDGTTTHKRERFCSAGFSTVGRCRIYNSVGDGAHAVVSSTARLPQRARHS